MARMKAKTRMLAALCLTFALLAGLLAAVGMTPAAAVVADKVQAVPDETVTDTYTTDASRSDFLGYSGGYYPNGQAFWGRGNGGNWEEHDQYLNERYDFFYNHENELIEAKVGPDTPKGFYVSARWFGYMQFNFVKPDGVENYATDPNHLTYIDSMVPKYEGTDVYLYGKDFELKGHYARLSYNSNAGVVLVGMRMAEPGRFTDENGIVDSGVFLKVNKDSVKLVDGGQEKTLELHHGDQTDTTVNLSSGTNNFVIVNVKLSDDTISGSVQPQDGTTYTFEDTVNYDTVGYAAVGFGSGKMDLHIGTYTVSNLKTVASPEEKVTAFAFDTAGEAATLMGWDGNKYWGTHYSSASEHYGIHPTEIDKWHDYLDGCFDMYYQNADEYKKMASPTALFGEYRQTNGSITETTGYLINVMYHSARHWMQISRGAQTYEDSTNWNKICALVPIIEGKPLTGKDFEATTAFRIDNTNAGGTALFGFRMKTAGKFVGDDKMEGADGVYLAANKSELYLIDNGEKTTLCTFYTNLGNGAEFTLSVRVNGTQLTGTITHFGTGHTSAFEAEISYDEAGSFAYGFAGNRFDLGSLSIDVQENMPEQYRYSVRGLLNWDIAHSGDTSHKAGSYVTSADIRTTADYGYGTAPFRETSNADRLKFLTYLDSSFDLYYNDVRDEATNYVDAETKTQKRNVHGIDSLAGESGGLYPSGIYLEQWLQWSSGTKDDNCKYPTTKVTDGQWWNCVALVPKDASGNPFEADDFTLSVEYRDNDNNNNPNTPVALIGFRMGTPGQFIGSDGVHNGVVLEVKETAINLWQNGSKTQLATCSISNGQSFTVNVTVKGDQLTGNVTRGSNMYSFESAIAEEVENEGRYFAYGFGNDRLDIGDVTITDETAVESEQSEPELTVRRANNTDPAHVGKYRYIVTVNPKGNRQLKAGSLVATEQESHQKLALQRLGYRDDPANVKEFEVYSDEDLTVVGEFYEPKTEEDANFAVIGTSVNTEKAGLRFVFRIAAYEKDGSYYMKINGEEKQISDFGAMFAVQKVLDNTYSGAELNFDLKGRDYVKDVSVPAKKVYYDKCNEYIDFAVTVLGIDKEGNKALPITARGYLTFTDGGETPVYIDAVSISYNQALALA